jgi:integral membrane protein
MKKYSQEQLIKYFKYACRAEFFSCILLFLIAMPLKYSYDWHLLMIPFGVIHGACFSAYLLLSVSARKIYHWDDEDFVFALMAAFIPFATYWVEKHFAKDRSDKNA